MQKKKVRALSLFSGGLDSILAVKLLESQGIEVQAVAFSTPFFDMEKIKRSAQENDINLKIADFWKEHLEKVKNPRFGWGKAMNPCIDCHLLMIERAGEMMREESFDFLATGEVLGQRPMSQNKKALEIIEKNSGVQEYLLRPLSAKLLDETIPEREGKVDREKLLEILGRSRKEQLALAKKFRVNFFPTPAGGCKLTEREYGEKLGKLLETCKKITRNDLELLSVGRHFWFGKNLLVVGKDSNENGKLKKLKKEKDVLAEAENIPGPMILVRNWENKEIDKEVVRKEIKKYLLKYNKKAQGKEIEIKWM